jgi:hypothetical protein
MVPPQNNNDRFTQQQGGGNKNRWENRVRKLDAAAATAASNVSGEVRGLNVTPEMLRDRVLELLNDPIAWGIAIGYDGTRSGRKQFTDFHRKMLAHAMRYTKSSTLCPRGHAKSTLLSVIYTSWKLLRNPEERILVASATMALAEKLIGEVRSRFMGQIQLFPGVYVDVIDIFPHLEVRSNGGRTSTALAGGPCHSFNIAGRSAGMGREPSIFAGSVGSSLAGNHPTLAIIDDPSTEQNSKTYGERQKVIEFLNQMVPLMYSPDSPICHIGTCWANEDVSAALRDREEWHQFRFGVWDGPPDENGDPTPLCPSFLNAEEIIAIEEDVNPSFFAAQYLNEPIPDDQPLFTKEMLSQAVLEEYSVADLNKGLLGQYPEILLFDPVGRMSGEHGSRNGFVVVKPVPAKLLNVTHDSTGKEVDPNRNIFVVTRAHEIAEGLETAVTWIEKEATKLHPNMKAIWIEKAAQQAAIAPWMSERGRLGGISIRMHKPKGMSSKDGKFMRIQGIQAGITRNLIMFPKDGFPGQYAFDQQLVSYPKVDYDDMITAIALLSNMLERRGALPGLPTVVPDPHTTPRNARKGRKNSGNTWYGSGF